MSSLLTSWREWARADAEARGITGLAPLLDGLAASLERLRSVDWAGELKKQASGDPPEGGRR